MIICIGSSVIVLYIKKDLKVHLQSVDALFAYILCCLEILKTVVYAAVAACFNEKMMQAVKAAE